jgi:ACS family D-galactonate transporter-like MFS transporter
MQAAAGQNESRFTKGAALALLWAAQFSCYAIRFALGVVAPLLMKLYHISPKTMGYVLSGWNWAYTASQLFVGPLVDRFGVWLVLGIGSGVWGVTTAILPGATTVASLFVMRALFGIGQSMLIPGTAASISRWFTANDRARAVAIAFSGNQVGLAIGGAIAAFVLAQFGWQAVFYCIGGASLVFTLVWFLAYPEKEIGRRAHPQPARAASAQEMAWSSLFRYRSTWGIGFGQMGYLYAYYFFITWLPGYLVLERHMTLLKSGIVSTLPFWAGMIGTLGGGWLADYLVQRGTSQTLSRKSVIGGSLAAATAFVVAAAFTASSWRAVTLLTLGVGALRMCAGPANSLPIDLAPKPLVGSLASIQNFFSNIGGLLAPIVTGYIVSRTGSFVGALIAAGAMALFGAVNYVFLMGPVETYGTGGKAAPALKLQAFAGKITR